MKKILLSFAPLFLFVVLGSAQNSSPYWSLAGNSNATSSSKLGTTNGINLRFYTNNSERARITTSGLFGIGTTNPTDKLHVNSASGSNAFRAQVNGSTKLLVHSGGGVSIGSGSTPPSNGLYVSGNAGIGTASPTAKLQVVGSSASNSTGIIVSAASYGIQASSTASGFGVSATSGNIGVYGSGGYAGLSGYGSGTGSYGVIGYGSSYGLYGNGGSYGVYGSSSSGNGIYGVSSNATAIFGSGYFGMYGSGTNTGVYGAGSSYGVHGFSSGGNGIYGYSSSAAGVYGQSYSNNGGYFYSSTSNGLWAQTSSTASNVYAGVFQGNVYTYNAYITSDKNLKKNIQEVSNAMSIINKLKPKNYEFRNDEKYASLQLPKGNHYGLLAQDLQQVLPDLVRDAPLIINKNTTNDLKKQTLSPTDDGATASVAGGQTLNQQQETPEIINTKAVNYTELIPLVIKGMQELSKENEDLRNEVIELKTLVQTLNKQGVNNQISASAFIKQNAPNPFNGNTTIGYYIPTEIRNAQILVTDMKGIVLRSYNVAKGEGQINIKSGELSTGTYNYTLYVGNTKIDTKQMIITK